LKVKTFPGLKHFQISATPVENYSGLLISGRLAGAKIEQLRFVPGENMKAEGYGEFLDGF